MSNTLLGVTEAARHLSCSPQHIRDMIDAGEIDAINIGLRGRNTWRIPQSQVLNFGRKKAPISNDRGREN